MKLPLWYKAKNGKWVASTHFEDGEVGLTMQEAVDNNLVEGYGAGMGHFHTGKFHFEDNMTGSRFLLKETQ